MFLKTDEVKIFNDDCRNVFPQLKDIALVVTSPPYNQLGKRFPKNTSNHKISIHNFAAKARSAYFDDRDEKTYAEFITDCFVQCRECCNWDASLVVNHKCRWRKRQLLHPIDLIRTFEPSWYLRQEVIWARKGSTAFQAKMFAPATSGCIGVQQTIITHQKANEQTILLFVGIRKRQNFCRFGMFLNTKEI